MIDVLGVIVPLMACYVFLYFAWLYLRKQHANVNPSAPKHFIGAAFYPDGPSSVFCPCGWSHYFENRDSGKRADALWYAIEHLEKELDV